MARYGEAQKRAVAKYQKKVYDAINLRVAKGGRDEIKASADAVGESVNGYIKEAIRRRMESGT